MPFLKSLVSKVGNALSSTTDMMGDSMLKMLTKKYPDIDEVFDTLDEMKKAYNITSDTDGDGSTEDEGDDDKWRPMLLTLGLLYKLQRIYDSNPNSWYNQPDIFVHNDEEETRLLHTFGFYWQYCMKIAEALRSIDNKGAGNNMDEEGHLVENEDTFNNVMASTGLSRDCILFAHATDSLHVDQHCPDFAIVLIHELKQILIVVCGTRMIPAPKMKDVFMDLYADAFPFLHGEAHMGMAIGANNILTKTMDKLSECIRANPGYNIMVTGYSLGAGICQLLAMELSEGETKTQLPEETGDIRCISFGAPPVFRPGDASYRSKNVFSVVYNNDGLASASVASVTKLFMQIRAVDRLQFRRRDMIKMLCKAIPTDDGDLDDDEDDDDDFAAKTGSTKITHILDEATEWIAIKEAADKAAQDCNLLQLEHPAQHLYLFKRKDGDVITRRLTDPRPLSTNLRLRAAMFNNHMPWGYNALFEGFGQHVEMVDLSTMDVAMENLNEAEGHSMYPDLSAETEES